MDMTNQESFAGNMTVNEAIQQFPRTVAVFNRFGMDACCGGALPVAEAAARHGVHVEALLAQLTHIMREDSAAARP